MRGSLPLLAITLLVGCTNLTAAPALTPPDAAGSLGTAARNTVRDQFVANFMAGDATALVEGFYLPDALGMFSASGETLKGHEELIAAWSEGIGAQEFNLYPEIVDESSTCDVAYESGAYLLRVVLESGYTERGLYAIVWKKDSSGRWRAAVHFFRRIK